MRPKGLYFAIAVVIILVAGYFVYVRSYQKAQAPAVLPESSMPQLGSNQATGQSQADALTPPTQDQPAVPPAAKSADNFASPAGGHFSTEGDITGPDVMVAEIDYNGSSFTPASVDIKVGDIVVFKNQGNAPFWPASNPHPVHTDYSAFDAKGPVQPGQNYQFKFTQAGNWKFHDHLNPSDGGVVNVTQK